MVGKLPEHAHHGHAEQDQEAVLVLIAEWRAARQDRDDDQGYQAADHGEQEDPGLYAAIQGRNHASTCPYRIPVGSLSSMGNGIMAVCSSPSAAIAGPNGPGRSSGRIRGELGRR